MRIRDVLSPNLRLRPVNPTETTIDNGFYDDWEQVWWDPDGPASGLHGMNPARCGYFQSVFASQFADRRRDVVHIVDLGCGGGLVSETLARNGYRVTGIDQSVASLDAARRHAAQEEIDVDYRYGSVYELELESGTVDGVVISDVLEHLHDLPRAISEIGRVLRPGGVMVFDTINRTVKSYLMAIAFAEKLVPLAVPHTHDWSMFVRPAELSALLQRSGLAIRELRGLGPALPLPTFLVQAWKTKRLGAFTLTDDTSVSYLGYATKATAAS
jgi:2-polyprenyl-6-hydroxyphenyl methylase / 3-demethylubiquinone-9 3-methyltransferase